MVEARRLENVELGFQAGITGQRGWNPLIRRVSEGIAGQRVYGELQPFCNRGLLTSAARWREMSAKPRPESPR